MSLFVSVDKDSRDVIVELENIQKTYLLGIEGVPALRGVNLKIYRGEFLIIYGTSGGGKTSLLNIVGTIDKPTKGRMTIDGERITSSTNDSTLASIRLHKMGFVFQTFNLLSTMTALQNVEMPMILKGKLTQKERSKRAKELLSMVGMAPRLDHLPSQLSGGEQQRVTIARSVANQPDILLLDEPTGDLDTKNTLIVMDLLCKLNEEEGITCIMVTHDPNLKYVANRVVSMRDGKIAKIEEIPDEQTKEARDLIRDRLKESMGGTNNKNERKTFTKIKKPQDYETFSKDSIEASDKFYEVSDHVKEKQELVINMKE
eukprot:gene1487-12104_t